MASTARSRTAAPAANSPPSRISVPNPFRRTHMKLRIPALVGAVALGSSLLFASIGSVGAVTTTGPSGKGVCAVEQAAVKAGASVEKLQAFGNCEINRRFATLTALSAKITSSKVITSAHAATLQSEIGSTRAGLTALKATIDGETSIP